MTKLTVRTCAGNITPNSRVFIEGGGKIELRKTHYWYEQCKPEKDREQSLHVPFHTFYGITACEYHVFFFAHYNRDAKSCYRGATSV